MKQRRLMALLATMGLLALLAAGCIPDETRGWAAALPLEETQVVSTTKGKLDGLDARTDPEPAWTGELETALDQTQTTISSTAISPTGTPFQGDILQVGEEMMRIESLRVSGTDRELEVERGFAGTFTAVHEVGTQIEAFRRPWRFPDDWFIPDGGARDLDGVYAQPVEGSDGVVYAGDYGGWVYAFRPGDVRLDAENEDEQPLAAAIELDDAIIGGVSLDEASDRLFVASGDSVYWLSASDFRDRLSNRDAPVSRGVLIETGGEVWAAPTLVDGTVLVASLDGNLYAVNGESGQIEWTYDGGSGLVTVPAVEGDLVMVAGFDGQLSAVDLASGELQWSFEASNWIWGQPAISDGIAYFGDFDGIVHAVNVDDGSEVWSAALERGRIRASPAIVDEVLVVATNDGWLLGLNASDGGVIWEREVGVDIRANLVASDGEVLLAPVDCTTPEGSEAETYYRAVNPADGELMQTASAC